MATNSVLDNLEKEVKEKGFRIIEKGDLEGIKDINSGAFGKVCTARDKVRQSVVAVKVLDITETFSSRQVNNFMKETEIMYKIRDEHILDIYGICYNTDVHQPFYSIVMPYMENGSVRSLFQSIENFEDVCEDKIHVPWALRTRILHQVASGMLFLHSSNILHLDLKASNILLNEDLKVKIADFGLSRIYAGTIGSRTNSKIGGTPTHIPPEYIKDVNKKPNQQFDMYSYGIFMWEVLTGAPAYQNCLNIEQLQMGVTQGSRPDENQLPVDIPEQHSYIIKVIIPLMKQCWDKDAQKRKSMEEVKVSLEPHYETHKRKAQEDVPVLLKQLADAKECSNQIDMNNKEVNQIAANLKNMTLEDFVQKKLYTNYSSKHEPPPEQVNRSIPVHNENQLNWQKQQTMAAHNPQQCYLPVNPNKYNPVQNQQHEVMPCIAVHENRQHLPTEQQYSEVSQDGASLHRHIHRQPASTTDSFELSSSRNMSDLNTRGYSGSASFTQNTSSIKHEYHISGNSSVHIGPTYIYHRSDNAEPTVKVNENPDLATNNVHVNDLKEEVSDNHLQQIARHLGSNYWRLLGRQCLWTTRHVPLVHLQSMSHLYVVPAIIIFGKGSDKIYRNCTCKYPLFSNGELDAVASDYSNEGLIETIYQMFRQWKEKHGHKATREWLATSLVYVNRRELIDNILNK